MLQVPEKFRETKHPMFKTSKEDGNNGLFIIPHHRIKNYYYNCLASDVADTEHVSVSLFSTDRKVDRCPTWEEMCFIKDLFWHEEDTVLQYHPPKSEYVNMSKNCLHLWRNVKTADQEVMPDLFVKQTTDTP